MDDILRNRIRSGILAAFFLLPLAAHADDIDIFAGPTSPTELPNVLIIWDSSANWSANIPVPDCFYTDNGSPWGDTSGVRWTGLKVWLLKLGVRVVHARPCHPQARGKNERFHRTLKDEVFAMRRFRNLPEVQRALDAWRTVYNLERPHEALGMDVPANRYRPSSRTMPDRLPRVEYDSGEIVRTVSSTRHYISFKGQMWKVPQAFARERLAIRALNRDGQYGIFFASWQVASIDLTAGQSVSDVSEQVSAMSPG